MESAHQSSTLSFLAGGGEMGALTRSKDWSETSLGVPESWPQSLRTTLGIALHSGFPMVLLWGSDLICFFNDAFRAGLGNEGKHPAILGTKGKDALPQLWTTIEPWIDTVLSKGEAVWHQDLLVPIYREGKMEDAYWTFNCSPIANDSNNVAGVLISIIETTGEIKAIKKLAESEGRFRTLADNIPNLVWMADAEGGIYWYNKKWYDYTGTTPEQMKGWGWRSVHDPNELPHVLEKWKNSIAHGVPFDMVFPIKGVDGKYCQFLTRILPLRDQAGKIVQWFGTNTDITQQIETEQALKESEERFRTMAEASYILIATGDETGNATYFNRAWFNLTGRTMDELLQLGWIDLIHPEDKENFLHLHNTSLKNRSAYSGEFRVYNTNGAYKYLLVHCTPLFRPGGSFAGFVSSGIDITELKNAVGKIQESEQDLRSMVLEAPIGICLLDAPTLVSEIVNESFIEIAGKPPETIVGKFYWDAFAEARPYYEQALTNVVEKGESYFASEVKLMLIRHGKEEVVYVTFVYAPLKDSAGRVKKVAIWVFENTKQVLARQKIEEAEQKTRLAIHSAELGLYEIEYASDSMITDDRMKEIWGFDHDAPRNTYAAIIHPDDMSIREEAHRISLITGQLDYQARLIRKDKSVRWVRITGSVIYDEQKSPVKLIGVVQDITEAVTTRRKIEEREQRFSDLIEQAPVAACVMRGRDFIVEIANEKFLELWDRTKLQLIGEPIFEALPEVARIGYKELFSGVYETGTPYLSNENLISILRNGKLEDAYLNFAFHPLYNTDKDIDGVIAIATEVTQQVLAKRKIEEVVEERTRELQQVNSALRKSEARHHLMVKEVQDYAILYLNPDGIVENWNLGAEKIKGYKAEEIIGKSFSTFYTEADLKADLPGTLLERARKTGRATQEGWRVKKDGSVFWASVVITALHNVAGEVIGFSKVTHDLTEKKKAEDKLKANAAELEQKNIELENMNNELQSFAYISSHDLQEPLRKIQTFASQILEKESPFLSDSGKDKFARMQNAAKRMQTLIDDLLAYSRTNTAERNFEKTSLQKIIEDVKEDIKEELLQRQAIIEFSGDNQVNVIPFQFRQLLFNLVSNSLKFSDETRTPRIEIFSEIVCGEKLKYEKLNKEKEYCHIRISDNGIGFDQAFSEKIFEVFQRLHGRAEYSGTGIGLAIVKKIVENHDGIIAATGVLNEGTTFDIYIPAS